MLKQKLILLVAGLLMAMATTATAGNKAESFSISPVVGGISFEGKQHLESTPLYGLKLGYNFTKEIGVEVLFDYALTEYTSSNRKSDFFRYGGEMLYNFMPDSRFVPYLAAGYAGVNFNHDTPLGTGGKVLGAFDYGVGAKFFLNDDIALRGDARHLLYDIHGTQHAFEYTVGLYFPFGGVKPAAKPVEAPPAPAPVAKIMDSDGDGVSDGFDKCPRTPAGVAVDKYGCPPVVQKVVILASEPKLEEKVVSVVAEKKAEVVVLVFEDIHFDFDQSTLKPEAKKILKRDIRLLKENPNTKIRVAGYTSASGSEEYNQRLSERRAKAVKDYLISEGVISPDRLSMIGYGEKHPAIHESAPKDIYSDAAKANIRVLFEIVVE